MIGQAWKDVRGCQQRQTCRICNTEDSMEHILTECASPARRKIWELAQRTSPHDPEQWPNITLGTILGVGCLTLPRGQLEQNDDALTPHKKRASLQLLQIILSEAAHLVWVLRCE